MAIHQDAEAFLVADDPLFFDELMRRSNAGVDDVVSRASFFSFQFVDYQAGIDDLITPNIPVINTQGRPIPYLMYASTENRRVSFRATFFDEDEPGESFRKARSLQALAMPWKATAPGDWYTDEYYPPPKLILALRKAEVAFTGFLMRVDVEFSNPLHISEDGTTRPQTAQVAIEFMVDGFVEYDAVSYPFG